MRLTAGQRAILIAMQRGDRLKVHRTVDRMKRYLLHRLDESDAVEVESAAANNLEHAGLIESNMKFPAATFLLTDKGTAAVARITGIEQAPIGPRNFD